MDASNRPADFIPAEENWGGAVFRRIPDVVRRDIGDETVLIPLARPGVADLACLYRMNAVGAAVWEALDGRTPAAAIVRRIRETFDCSAPDGAPVDSIQIERDVRDFVSDLLEAGLAEPGGARPPA